MLTNIASLRLHHCVGLHKTWSGLFSLLNALPKLQVCVAHMLRAHLQPAGQRLQL